MDTPKSVMNNFSVFRHMIVYNLVSFSFNLYDAVLLTWIMYFYIPPEGSGKMQFLSMTAFSVIMFGGRVFDAVTDPVVGYLSDNTKSRWGRRKPYIFAGAPLIFISFVLAWIPPIAGENSYLNGAYLAFILFIYYWAYTSVLIPWFAVLPEMHQNNEARTKVASAGVAIGIVGALVGGGLSGPLIEWQGVRVMAIMLGPLGLIASGISLFAIDEKKQTQAEELKPQKGFIKVLREVFTDFQVISFSVMITLVQMTYQFLMMNTPYFAKLILGRDEAAASMLIGIVIIIIACSTPLWYWLLSRFPKRNVMRGAILSMAFGFVLCFFIGKLPALSITLQAILILPVVAVPMGGMFTSAVVLIADLTDYDEVKTGERREAVYYGIYGIVRKAGWALCSMIVLGIYNIFGYSAENSLGVQVVWLVCAVFCILGFIAFIPYRVGDSLEENRKIFGIEAKT